MKRLRQIVLLLCTFAPSSLRLAVWRMLGFKVGRHCRVSMFSVVVADEIEVGPGSVIEAFTLIFSPRLIRIGERSRIASFVRMIGWKGEVHVGPQTFIALGCLIDVTGDFHLGARSQIGPRSMLYTHGETGLIFNVRYPHRNGSIRIGEDCWVCMGCLVFPDVTIGDKVVILPGTTVHHDLPSGRTILPAARVYRMSQTRFLQETVTQAHQQDELRDLLHRFGATRTNSHIVETHDHVLTLEFPRQRRVHLLLSETGEWLADMETSKGSTVVWAMDRVKVPKNVTQFCFGELAVFGPWTRFAEQVAVFLCETGGAHFVFEGDHSRSNEHENQ